MSDRHGRRMLGYAAVVVVAGAVAAGCGGGGGKAGEGATATTVPDYDAAKGVASPAAELRARFTELLQGHVLLTGITASTALAGQDPAPAAAVLDQNGVALADEVTRLYEAAVGQQFLALWNRHTASLLGFARATAAGDQAKVAAAKAELEAYVKEMAVLLNTVNPQLAVDAMSKDQKSYVTKVQSALTAQAKKDAAAPAKLKEAADHMPETASLWVAGIVKQKAKTIEGTADGIAATLVATMTAKLQQHVYLAGVTTGASLAGGDPAASAEALDENSVELSRAIGAVYGDDAGRQFLVLWRRHIELLVDFTKATAARDQVGAAKARADLDGYRTAFGAFLGAANPNFGKDDVASDLKVHVDSLMAAIAAQAAKDPTQFQKLRDAAGHMPRTASFLAEGIARQFPRKFG